MEHRDVVPVYRCVCNDLDQLAFASLERWPGGFDRINEINKQANSSLTAERLSKYHLRPSSRTNGNSQFSAPVSHSAPTPPQVLLVAASNRRRCRVFHCCPPSSGTIKRNEFATQCAKEVELERAYGH